MKLFVGLGNPGKEYENTRHNMGFISIDKFADILGASFDRSGFKGEYAIVKKPELSETIILLKPMTFMNLSGESVRAIADFYKIDPSDILVVYDDMDTPVGRIRIKPDGSSGGHNGIKNIIEHMGTDKIRRIKVGIGKPLGDSISFVLGKPSKEDAPLIEEATDNAAKAMRDSLLKSFPDVMGIYNSKKG